MNDDDFCKGCYHNCLWSMCNNYKQYGTNFSDCKDRVFSKKEHLKQLEDRKNEMLCRLLENGYEAKYEVGDVVYYLEYGYMITQTTIREVIPQEQYNIKFRYKVKNKIHTFEEDLLYKTPQEAFKTMLKDYIRHTRQEASNLYKKGTQFGIPEEEMSELIPFMYNEV